MTFNRKASCHRSLVGSVTTAASLFFISVFSANSIANTPNTPATPTIGASNEWLYGGGQPGKPYYSQLKEINKSNIDKLGLAWATSVDTPMGLVSEPIIVNNVAYISAALSVVYAIDVKSGKQLWKFTPKLKLDGGPGTSWSARTNRGVAFWEGKVFVGTGDCRLIAIDAEKGTQLWDSQICDAATSGGLGGGVTGAPSVGNGKVFIGHSGSEMGARGSVVAFDSNTGKVVWRFWTTPGAPGTPYEDDAVRMAAKTWKGGYSEVGGAAAWDAITFDAETNQLIFGTASSLPYSHALKNDGDRLFTNSIVAVDADTGKYKWHYQTTPEDSFDYDAAMHILVTDLVMNGKARRVVMQAPKNGFFYVLDAKTGKLLSADPFVPVNWATHVDLKTGRPVIDPAGEYYRHPDKKTLVYPAMTGAHNWQSMSFNPRSGLVYFGASEKGTYWTVGPNGDGMADLTNLGPDGKPILNNGKLLAWDPLKKAPAWKVDLKFPYNGGTLSTAGDLVFFGETTGRFGAYDPTSGKSLWHFDSGVPIAGNPATAMVDGEQYVLVNAGEGTAMSYATTPEMTRDGDSSIGKTMLMAFKLGGNGKLPESAPLNARIPLPSKQPTSVENTLAGKSLWKLSSCYSCHGAHVATRGRRILNGGIPDLRFAPSEVHDMWLGILFGGRADKGMPNFAGMINLEQANQIHDWVLYRTWKDYCAQQDALGEKSADFCAEIKSGKYEALEH
ncbi:alcohol dehydrogenase [Pseudomonas citronellolis]|uniref:PQQ-dependent dehydrogenase, methanol/ethanol family n=1 Tax=Pseudomonas citronellolis TaxID=53408 RepID=UPI000E2FBFB2|nr:PQQ-dependent dehydrogenase, methanol/ethanol family [Pseudomonas citronellolis]GBL58042.1 alcohol dehydrogenase [Pseudomonas citronellolis]